MPLRRGYAPAVEQPVSPRTFAIIGIAVLIAAGAAWMLLRRPPGLPGGDQPVPTFSPNPSAEADEADKEARAVLQKRVAAGQASMEELKMLRTLCLRVKDTACVQDTDRLIAEKRH
jgi:hypothetical protein